jgi:hypothetical protein
MLLFLYFEAGILHFNEENEADFLTAYILSDDRII